MKNILIEAAGGTDAGRVRSNNEDSFFCDPQQGIFIVADGMGGHNSGEVASSLAVEMVRDFLIHKSESLKNLPRLKQVILALEAANALVYEKGRAFPKNAGMGTTIVCALSDGNTLTVAHVGDSRLYLFRNGNLVSLTEDHSVIQDQIRDGLISGDDAAQSHLKNILTRAIGAAPDVVVDASEHPLFSGDTFLLASDGLMKMLPDQEITNILSLNLDPSKTVSLLISKACNAGGVDNITVIVARTIKKQRMLPVFMSKFFER